MDYQVALDLLKAFPAYHLRIFRKFPGFPENCSQQSEGGYVVFVDSSVFGEPCYNDLKDYAEACDLCITPFGHYLMVSSQ
jgi:hypothetical protein